MFGVQQVVIPAALYAVMLGGLIYLALWQAVVTGMAVFEKMQKRRTRQQ